MESIMKHCVYYPRNYIQHIPNKDMFCWRCHHEGVNICCETCPRSFHQKCLKQTISDTNNWVCPECVTILKAESTQTRSTAMKGMTLEHLCSLLKFAAKRMMECNGFEPFLHPVNDKEFPEYKRYIVQPMTLTSLDKNIKDNLYGSTQAFQADAKWILHNSIIFNSYQSKLTTFAKTIIKICKQEMAEIENCPSCYLNANTKKSTWFVEVCPKPHILVWAKLKGFPYWPAKAMSTNSSGMVDVRFFGAHDRAWVPFKECFLYSRRDPNSNKQKRNDIIECMREVEVYISNLKALYGEFNYAPFKLPYDPDNELRQQLLFIPRYRPNAPPPKKRARLSEGRAKTPLKKEEDVKQEENAQLDIKEHSEEIAEGYGTDDDPMDSEPLHTRKGTITLQNTANDSIEKEEEEEMDEDSQDSDSDEEKDKIEPEMDEMDDTQVSGNASNDKLSKGNVKLRGVVTSSPGKLNLVQRRISEESNTRKRFSVDESQTPTKISRRNSDQSVKSDSSRLSGLSDKINRVDISENVELTLGNTLDSYITSSTTNDTETRKKPVQIDVENEELSISPQSKVKIIDRLMKKLSSSDEDLSKSPTETDQADAKSQTDILLEKYKNLVKEKSREFDSIKASTSFGSTSLSSTDVCESSSKIEEKKVEQKDAADEVNLESSKQNVCDKSSVKVTNNEKTSEMVISSTANVEIEIKNSIVVEEKAEEKDDLTKISNKLPPAREPSSEKDDLPLKSLLIKKDDTNTNVVPEENKKNSNDESKKDTVPKPEIPLIEKPTLRSKTKPDISSESKQEITSRDVTKDNSSTSEENKDTKKILENKPVEKQEQKLIVTRKSVILTSKKVDKDKPTTIKPQPKVIDTSTLVNTKKKPDPVLLKIDKEKKPTVKEIVSSKPVVVQKKLTDTHFFKIDKEKKTEEIVSKVTKAQEEPSKKESYDKKQNDVTDKKKAQIVRQDDSGSSDGHEVMLDDTQIDEANIRNIIHSSLNNVEGVKRRIGETLDNEDGKTTLTGVERKNKPTVQQSPSGERPKRPKTSEDNGRVTASSSDPTFKIVPIQSILNKNIDGPSSAATAPLPPPSLLSNNPILLKKLSQPERPQRLSHDLVPEQLVCVEIKSEPDSSDGEESEYMEKKRKYMSALNISEKTDEVVVPKKNEIRTRSKTEELGKGRQADNLSKVIDSVATSYGGKCELVRKPTERKTTNPPPLHVPTPEERRKAMVQENGEIFVKSFAKMQHPPQQQVRASSVQRSQVQQKPKPTNFTAKTTQSVVRRETPQKSAPELSSASSMARATPTSSVTTTAVSQMQAAPSVANSKTIESLSSSGNVLILTQPGVILPTSQQLTYNAGSFVTFVPSQQNMTMMQTPQVINAMVAPGLHQNEGIRPTQPANVEIHNAPVASTSSATAEIRTEAAPADDEFSLLHSMVPEAVSRAISEVLCRPPPKLKPRPPGPLSQVFDSGNPSSAGPISAKINSISHRLGDYFRGMLIEMLEDLGKTNTTEATIASLKHEVETLTHKHSAEMMDIRKNVCTILKDIQGCIAEERERIVDETRSACEVEALKRIEEAKSKQWCANCGKEAQFYCCWNTSYCDYPCQQKHWAKHMNKCTQHASQPQAVQSPAIRPQSQITFRPATPKSFAGRIVAKPTKVYLNRTTNPKGVPTFKSPSGSHLALVDTANLEFLTSTSMGAKFIASSALFTKVKQVNSTVTSPSNGTAKMQPIILNQKINNVPPLQPSSSSSNNTNMSNIISDEDFESE